MFMARQAARQPAGRNELQSGDGSTNISAPCVALCTSIAAHNKQLAHFKWTGLVLQCVLPPLHFITVPLYLYRICTYSTCTCVSTGATRVGTNCCRRRGDVFPPPSPPPPARCRRRVDQVWSGQVRSDQVRWSSSCPRSMLPHSDDNDVSNLHGGRTAVSLIDIPLVHPPCTPRLHISDREGGCIHVEMSLPLPSLIHVCTYTCTYT